jgi:HD-GYP domain-containing protein (c-di-GMP phosphodiesterase class II)
MAEEERDAGLAQVAGEGQGALGDVALGEEYAALYRDLKDRIGQLESLIEASAVFSSTLDLDQVLDHVMTEGQRVLDAEASSVFQIDEETKELYFVLALGEKGEEVKKIRVPWGQGVVGWVAEHAEPLLVADVTKDPRFYQKVDEKSKFQTRSILAVPLIVKGKVIGVAEVLNKRSGTFSDKDLEMFQGLARQAAIAIENATLYREQAELSLGAVTSLATAIDAKDPYTIGHSERVTKYSRLIGYELGLGEGEQTNLEWSAILHDVGKIGIPDNILQKPGDLTDKEWAAIRTHPLKGAEIMAPIKPLRNVIPGMRHHHERYDGTGYPDGLADGQIPKLARIITVADSFDAMLSDRPYRAAMREADALKRLRELSGSQFDGEVVEAFVRVYKRERIRGG